LVRQTQVEEQVRHHLVELIQVELEVRVS
jgi:hypothetical protein